MPRYRRILKAVLALSLFCLPAPLLAQDAPAVEELLRYVPDDPAFCFVLRDLRGHSGRLADSPFLAQFKQSPLGVALASSKELGSFAELDKQFQQFLGVGLKEIRNDVLGDGLVFAYWPEQSGQAERGVFLTRARRADLLAKLVKQLKELGVQSGDFKNVEARRHRGWDYLHGEDKAGKKTFLLVQDRLLALAEDEATLQRVIERAQEAAPASPVSRQLAELGLQDALAVLLLNPRAFDAAIAAKLQAAVEPDRSFLSTLSKYWLHTSVIALSLRLEDDLAVGLTLRLDTAKLPPSAQRLFRQASESSPLWNQFPDRTIFAFAGRLNAAALLQVLMDFAPEENRKEQLADLEKNVRSAVGLDLLSEVLPNLGPDWGLFVATPDPKSQGWFPHVLLAIRVQAQPAHKPLDEALFEPLRTVAGLLAIAQSKETGKRIDVKTHVQNGVQMVTLSGEMFPAGCRPTMALKAGCLVFASSPESVALLKPPGADVRQSAKERMLLARLSVAEGIAFLEQKERRAALVDALARAHAISPAEVTDGIDKLTEVLRLFDQLELTQESRAGGHVQLTLRLKTVKPLRK